jgi:hypothetical protein
MFRSPQPFAPDAGGQGGVRSMGVHRQAGRPAAGTALCTARLPGVRMPASPAPAVPGRGQGRPI